MLPMEDWDHTFLPALAALLSGGDPYRYIYNPPWALLPLVPFALLPPELGRLALLLAQLAVYVLIARRMGADLVTVLAFMLAPLTLHALVMGNVEWLTLAGLLFPPPIALLFFAIKPQVGALAALFLVIEAWRRGGARGAAWTVAPLAIALVLSVFLFGFWFLRALDYLDFSGTAFNFSLFPYSLGIGLPLFAAALRTRRIEFALAASPCVFPVVILSCYVGVPLALVRRPLETIATALGSWGAVIFVRWT